MPFHLLAKSEEILSFPIDGANDEKTHTPGTAPNPLDLQPNWWTYFDINSENFIERINEFNLIINDLINSANDDYKKVSIELNSRVQASLKALDELRKLEAIPIPEKKAFKDTYTLDDARNIVSTLREVDSIYKTQLPDYKDDQKIIKALERKIDTLYATYRKIETSNQEKLVAGLEVIATRLSWLVSTKKQPLQKDQLDNYKTRIKWLKEEIEHALNNLQITNNELKSIDNEISKKQADLDAVQRKYIDAQSRTLEIIEEDLVSSFKSSLFKQKALQAEIKVAREEILLDILKTKKSIIQAYIQEPGVQYDELAKQYQMIDTFLKDFQIQIEDWRAALRKERELLNDLMLDKDRIGKDQVVIDQIIQDRRNVSKDTSSILRNLDGALSDLELFNNIFRDQLIKTQGLLFKLRTDSAATLSELWESTRSLFTKSIFSISDVPVTTVDIIHALVILLIAYAISRIVRKLIIRFSGPSGSHTSSSFYTLGRLLHYLIIIIGLIVALSSIGLNFTNLAIVAGALSVGIGFGLQSIVNNFVSGIIVLFEQNIKVGDFVQLESGMTGVVKGIHVRSTVITTLDNLDIIVPNSELVTAKVVNYTMNEPMFRIHVPFGVAYGSDKAIVEKAGLEAARKVEVTYDDGAKRRPQVWLVGFGDSSLNFELIVWVVNKQGLHATPGSWKALYTWEIETALHKYGIEIPFPQRDLHLRSGFVNRQIL